MALRIGPISPGRCTCATFFGVAKKKQIMHRARTPGKKRQRWPLPELGARSTIWNRRDRKCRRLLSDVWSTRLRQRVQYQLTGRHQCVVDQSLDFKLKEFTDFPNFPRA